VLSSTGGARQRPEKSREVLVRAVRASALARNDDIRHAVFGEVRTHLACPVRAFANMITHDARLPVRPASVVAPAGLQLREHLGVAVA